MNEVFRKFAQRTSEFTGSPWTFMLAVLIIVVWGLTGPVFKYSDTWQLVINTGTTIVTFLMVFLIQNTQNRDAKALQLKLDELIRAHEGARNQLVDLEELSDEDLARLEEQFRRIQERGGTDPLEADGPGAGAVVEAIHGEKKVRTQERIEDRVPEGKAPESSQALAG